MFGLHHTLNKWISSFLSERSIAIRVDSYLSNPHSINSGVPQGSVITPVLFILFIIDLLSSTSSSIFSFANGTYLSSSFSSNPQHLVYSNTSPYQPCFSPMTWQMYRSGIVTTLLSLMKKRQHRFSYHINITKISPLFS